MTSDGWFWAQKAQDLRLHQLEAVRKQAESWRTGLAGLTALFGSILLVKGPNDITNVAMPYEQIVVGLFGIAFGSLVSGTLLAVRAASGAPGDECLLAAEDLAEWTRGEVRRAQQKVTAARFLTLIGVCIIAISTGMIWLAPSRTTKLPVIAVHLTNTSVCGSLISIVNGVVLLRNGNGDWPIALKSVKTITPESSCP